MANVKGFAKKVAEDKTLAEALAKAASKEEFLAKAEEAGFELTDADLAELAKAGEGELSDDALEGAAGGYNMDSLLKFGKKKFEAAKTILDEINGFGNVD